jgi:Putative phage tail protein
MSFLFQRKQSILEYYGLQISGSIQATPIPIIYGAPRVTCNIIYSNGFHAVKQKTGKGGKGILSGGKGQTAQYLYYATLIAALGEGPITQIIVIYQDSNVWFNLSQIREIDPNNQTNKSGQPNFVPTNATLFAGVDDQAPWSYVESNWPDDARGYKDTCYIGLPNMQLDSSAAPPQLNFVPGGMFSGTCPLNPATFNGQYTDNNGQHPDSFFAGYIDADPALCVHDFLTNSRYGVGFPASLIDPGIFSSVTATTGVGDAAFQTYCQAIGFGWSVVLNNAEAASSILERWMKNMAVGIVWTGEMLKFIPYWDTPTNTNPGWGGDNPNGIPKKSFVPNVQVLMNLTDDHFLQAQNPEEEPVTLDRKDPIDVYNYVRVNYRDRTNQFNENIAADSDEVAIELYGPRVDNTQVADEFNVGGYAALAATVQLRRNMSVRRKITFRLPPVFAFFDPMDIITVTSGTFNNFSVRIVSIEEDDTGTLTFVAEEFPTGAGSPSAFAAAPTTPPAQLQTNAPAGPVNVPVVFEPTTQMLAAQGNPTPQIIIGASGSNGVADPNWGGCAIYASADNLNYTLLGNLTNPSRQGTLSAGLNAWPGANPDNTNTLSVTLVESGGDLTSATSALAAQAATLCAIIDGAGCLELLSFTTATLTGLHTYNLTGLYRGLYGTQPLAHINGAQFLRVDNQVFESQLPPGFIGKTVYVKMTSFNIYNQGEEDLSSPDVIAYTYIPTGAGSDLTSNAIAQALLAGQSVDLDAANGSLDLNIGGGAACAPVIFDIDLGNI